MKRIAVVLATFLAVAAPTPALAWSNAPGGPDSYGTHDWILDKAINAAGNKANWVRKGVALRATDDPDTKDGIDLRLGDLVARLRPLGERVGRRR